MLAGKPMPQAEVLLRMRIGTLVGSLEDERARRERAEADLARLRDAAEQAQQDKIAAICEREAAEAAQQATNNLRRELFRYNRGAIGAAAQAVNAMRDASCVAHKTREAVMSVRLETVAAQRGGCVPPHMNAAVNRAEALLSQRAGLLESETQYARVFEPTSGGVHHCEHSLT